MKASIRNLVLAAYVVAAGGLTLQTGLASKETSSRDECFAQYSECYYWAAANCPGGFECDTNTFTCSGQYDAICW
jgi:hypothetical protein